MSPIVPYDIFIMKLSLLFCLALAAPGLAGHASDEAQTSGLEKRSFNSFRQWLVGRNKGWDKTPDTPPSEEQKKNLRMPVSADEFCAFHRAMGWFAWQMKRKADDKKQRDDAAEYHQQQLSKGILTMEKLTRLMDNQLRNTPSWSETDQLSATICYPYYASHESAFLNAIQDLAGRFPKVHEWRWPVAHAIDGLQTCREVFLVRRIVHSRWRFNRLINMSLPDPLSNEPTGRARFLHEVMAIRPKQVFRRYLLIKDNCCPYHCFGPFHNARVAWKPFPPTAPTPKIDKTP
ncbi:hypothetical protein L249_7851 [Ophiocordyceps polyrhachis-furcata BCC 54312]|uniref:Uncharacterized protein n=1 Tax=Ophiocordyceps polyrhachis-furcata BCC 54312 TaxID=1330021 RepID=A0A367L0L1_9HYPO|nr:hypothetical protein L249_7851 [Ophiocordyceps polyrhachis-furcata BCC 54312]